MESFNLVGQSPNLSTNCQRGHDWNLGEGQSSRMTNPTPLLQPIHIPPRFTTTSHTHPPCHRCQHCATPCTYIHTQNKSKKKSTYFGQDPPPHLPFPSDPSLYLLEPLLLSTPTRPATGVDTVHSHKKKKENKKDWSRYLIPLN